MTDRRDHYKVLQVDPEADPEVIQAAFRRLAQKFHPDVAPGPDGAARMIAINAAWEALRDPLRRASYDLERASAARSSAAEIVRGSARGAGASAAPGSAAGAGRISDTGSPAAPAAGGIQAAGPPPGDPSGSVLNFGRYAGWSLGEIARRDLEYIEWLDRMPIGRPYRGEIDAILRQAGRRRAADVEATERHGLFRRR